MDINQTILNSWHRNNGARMVDFAGWDMPLNYQTGAKAEHLMVRRSSGLFDISHMGRFLISCKGEQALGEYEYLISSGVASLPIGKGSYGLLCKDDGGILDDIFNFRLDSETFLLVVNASNRQKDFTWIESHFSAARLHDVSDEIAMIALQGPRAIELLVKGGFLSDESLVAERNSISPGSPLDGGIMTRTGYTGEDGVEIYAPNARIIRLWPEILAAAEMHGIECGPIGLAARDSLRFEPGYPLYGHELNEKLSAREAGLKWACKMGDSDPDFCGKDALRAAFASNEDYLRLRSIKMKDPGMPRQDMKVLDDSGTELGWVCSGMASPSLDGFYANIYLRQSASQIGKEVYIDIRGQHKAAVIVKRPLYKAL